MRIEQEGMIVEDTMDRLVETEEEITCGCGDPELTITMYLDGLDYYQYNYSCQCGNQIVMMAKIEEESTW